MGKAIVPFDTVTMRWLNESYSDKDGGLYSAPSQIFYSGFNDPTYLTFRVEFGDWGYSTRNFNEILTYAQSESPNGYGASYKYRYDDYPMGLLDPNFAEDSIKAFPNYSFNNQVVYNAYNYLLQRNEDTRAEYLKNFVIGLYEIQHDYPYIFQDISGIDSLVDFSDERGYRIKDGEISITCLEGLSQKVRTLMELYKKAAWDEVYQRWILPQNYRQFKMIIYVFERRRFHSTMDTMKAESAGGSDNEGGAGPKKQNLGSQIVNFLLSASSYSMQPGAISGQASNIGPAWFNADLPVKAYECFLCEFNLQTKDGDAYSAHYDTSDALQTTISIKVKNVKTYMKNNLTKRLQNMLIFDLASNIERSYDKESDSYQSTVPGRGFLNRETLLGNEIGVEFRQGFGGGGNSSDVYQSKQLWDNMVNNWKALFGKGAAAGGQPTTGTVESYMAGADLSAYHDSPASWWHPATVAGPHIKRGGNFFDYLWDIIKQGTTQIRLGPGYASAQSAVFYNILDFIDYRNSPALSYYSVATQHRHKNMPKIRPPRELADNPEFPEMGDDRDMPDVTVELDVDEYRDASVGMTDTSFVYHDTSIPIIDTSFSYHDTSTNIAEIEYDYRNMVDPEMPKMSDYRDHPDSNMISQEGPRGLPEQQMENLDSYRELYGTDMPEALEPREIPEFGMPAQTEPRDLPEYGLDGPETFRDIPEAQMHTQGEERVLSPLEMTETMSGRELNDQDMIEMEGYRESNTDIVFEMPSGRELTVYKLEETLEPGRELPEHILVEQHDLIDMISKATSGMSENFQNVNEGFLQAERMIKDLLEQGDSLYKDYQDQIESRKNIIEAMMDFKDDSKKDMFIDRIKTLQVALKQLTESAARSLPELQQVAVKSKNPEDLNKKFSLVPTDVVRRIHNNSLLFSIEPEALERMSYQSLMAIDQELLRAIADSEALMYVLRPESPSKATEAGQSISSGGVKQTNERKSTKGKKLIG